MTFRKVLRKVFCVLVVGYLMCLVAYCTMPFAVPELHTIDAVDSPDGQWVARRAVKVYASIFSLPDNVVLLQPKGWLGNPWGKVICAIVIDLNPEPPKVTWRNAHELLIKLPHSSTPQGTPYLQLQEYKGIKISYEVD